MSTLKIEDNYVFIILRRCILKVTQSCLQLFWTIKKSNWIYFACYVNDVITLLFLQSICTVCSLEFTLLNYWYKPELSVFAQSNWWHVSRMKYICEMWNAQSNHFESFKPTIVCATGSTSLENIHTCCIYKISVYRAILLSSNLSILWIFAITLNILDEETLQFSPIA